MIYARIFFCLLCIGLYSQNAFTQCTGSAALPRGLSILKSAKVDVMIQDVSFIRDTVLKRIKRLPENDLMSNLIFEVVSGELHIHFDLNDDHEFYTVSIEKIDSPYAKDQVLTYCDRVYGDIGHLSGEHLEQRTIMIGNNAENINPEELTGTLQIKLKVEALFYPASYSKKFWRLKYDCRKTPPKWYQREAIWIPPAVVTVVGGALLVSNKDYKSTYNNYRGRARNTAGTENEYNTANEIWQKERRKDRWGIGLLAAAVAWVGIQHWRDREREDARSECFSQYNSTMDTRIRLSFFQSEPTEIPIVEAIPTVHHIIGLQYTF